MARSPGKPFERTYWVVPGKLLAGCYPGDLDDAAAAARLTGLLDAGIRCVIALTEAAEGGHDGKPFAPYESALKALAQAQGVRVRLERHAIRDMSVPTPDEMRRTLDAIDNHMEAGKPVYVHCWGGYGRTGTVVGCWLARHGMAAGRDVLERLQRLRRGLRGESPQTDAQRIMVATWPRGA
mgnify:CR=1 FL=1